MREGLPITALVEGAYYAGRCRNATIARWDGMRFHHWRRKFGHEFIEKIEHPDNDSTFDVFVAQCQVDEWQVKEIPLVGG